MGCALAEHQPLNTLRYPTFEYPSFDITLLQLLDQELQGDQTFILSLSMRVIISGPTGDRNGEVRYLAGRLPKRG